MVYAGARGGVAHDERPKVTAFTGGEWEKPPVREALRWGKFDQNSMVARRFAGVTDRVCRTATQPPPGSNPRLPTGPA